MEHYNGKYTLNSSKSESFEPILLLMGISWALRKVANSLIPTHEINFSDKQFNFTVITSASSKSESYIFDGEEHALEHERFGASISTAKLLDNGIELNVVANDKHAQSNSTFKWLDNNSYELTISITKGNETAKVKRHFDRV